MKRFGRVGKVPRLEAVAKFRRWLADEYPAIASAGTVNYSVDSLCREYFEQMGKRYVVDGKHTTSITRIRIALDSFRAKYGEREADSITAGMTAAWLEGFIHERKTKKEKATGDKRRMVRGTDGTGVSHNDRDDEERAPKPRTKETCNLALTYVKRMYRWGAKYGKVADSAAGAVQLAENLRSDHPELRRKDAIGPVARETVEATKALCPPIIQALIEVLWLTGMRPGEIRSMRPCDLTVSDGMRVYTPRRHKTSHKGKVRKIVLGPRAWRIIEPLLPSRTDAPVFPVNQSAGNLALYIARRAKRTSSVPRASRRRWGTRI
jgi:integrase